ncbi:MAG TPA: cobalamin-independent methionine synthase II family protein [Stellaceae bacterium]|nr:cobalamin-independent methionine synthase II family protein [Stellaceae bacterium]
MKPSKDRILTTHAGSLPRPAALRPLLAAKDKGEPFDAAALEAQVKDAVRETVARQVKLGIDLVSDGEMSKVSYSTYVTERISGYSGSGPGTLARDLQDFPEFAKTSNRGLAIRRALCEAPLAAKDDGPLQRDLANFRAAVDAAHPTGAYMTAASPGVVAYFLRNRYYPSHEAYLAALVPLMRAEYEAIVAAGFDVQLDCPDLAMSRHLGYADASDAEFQRLSEQAVEAIGAATKNIPADRMRVHLCWGNYPGPHHHDLALERVLPFALKTRAQAISFEGANPRHEHEWEVFETLRLPDDRVILPGVIDSATNFIEHPRLVAQRIERYANVVGKERVVACVDCGFGTSAMSQTVDPDIAWAKLGALAEGAKIASDRLWRR